MRVAPERVAEAIKRYALTGTPTGEVVVRPNGELRIMTAGDVFHVCPAGWRIADSPGVDEALLIRRDTFTYNANPVHGLLFETDGTTRLLNERAAMTDLGRRLGAGLDPIAYAEVVAALYSGGDLDAPVVTAHAADFSWPAGELFTGSKVYPDPLVQRSGDLLRIHFFSGQGFIDHGGGGNGNHIYRWRITGGPGRDPEWEREYVGFDGR
ncbi:hypothetical protein AB0F81_37705 [Actinoplanes sp. NPDC024001]|uniref:hypothetical protein n=1 Tax=Actinoplanes sp. NPDC024001 TaxID=3154598 RepID=UPI00341164BD